MQSRHLREHTGARVRFAGVIAATRRVPTGSAETAQFLTLEDEHGLVEARIAPGAYERLHASITTPGPYLFLARVEERLGVTFLRIEELLPFHERARLDIASHACALEY